jgi:hypothetical protein
VKKKITNLKTNKEIGMRRCEWFGHKWKPVYIGKNNKWRIIATYCERCWYGYDDLINYVEFLKYKKGYDFGTYSEKYFTEANNH